MLGLGGFALLAVFGVCLNFVLPIAPSVSLGAAAVGVLLFVRSRRRILAGLTPRNLAWALVLVGVVSALASRPVLHYDTGLYHLQAIGWMEDGPVPLGLGNVDLRLGLNSSWFSAAALMRAPSASERPLLSSSLLAFFLLSAVLRAFKSSRPAAPSGSRFLVLFLALPCAAAAADGTVPSASTDLPVTAMAMLAAALLSRGLEDGTLAREAPLILCLSLFAVTVKLSAAPLLLFGAAAIALAGAPGSTLVSALRAMGPALAPALLILGPWTARGLLLTGRLFYPLPLGSFGSFPWTVPERLRAGEIRAVATWARSVGLGPVVLVAVVLTAAGALLVVSGRKPIPTRPLVVPLLLSAAGVAFWIVTAPDPRFGAGFLFSVAALVLFAGMSRSGLLARTRWREAALVGIVAAPAFAAFTYIAVRGRLPRLALLDVPPLPRVVAEARRTNAGDAVLVPIGGERCFDAPRPCTPFFRPDLVIERDRRGRPVAFRLPD